MKINCVEFTKTMSSFRMTILSEFSEVFRMETFVLPQFLPFDNIIRQPTIGKFLEVSHFLFNLESSSLYVLKIQIIAM